MIRAGIVPGTLDEDGYVDEFDYRPADELILAAIASLGGAETEERAGGSS